MHWELNVGLTDCNLSKMLFIKSISLHCKYSPLNCGSSTFVISLDISPHICILLHCGNSRLVPIDLSVFVDALLDYMLNHAEISLLNQRNAEEKSMAIKLWISWYLHDMMLLHFLLEYQTGGVNLRDSQPGPLMWVHAWKKKLLCAIHLLLIAIFTPRAHVRRGKAIGFVRLFVCLFVSLSVSLVKNFKIWI